jgi:hypothetical protein
VKQRRGRRAGAWLALALTLCLAVLVGALVAVHRSAATGGRTADHAASGQAADANDGDHSTTTVAPTTDPVFHHVLVVGDSLGVDIGQQLSTQFALVRDVTVNNAAVPKTGLDDTAFYDWPTHLATLLALDRPTLVVVLVGANDDQGLYAGGAAASPGSAAWDRAYAARVHTVLAEATTSGAEVAWVGAPPMERATLNHWMRHVDGIFERQTARYPSAVYVDSTPVLGSTSGGFQLAGADGTVLRTDDGVHLTSAGASLLAAAVVTAVAHHDRGWTTTSHRAA